MSLFRRIGNLWKLSDFEPGQATDETKQEGTIVSMIVKKPEPPKFIPRVKIDPVKEITEEQP
jgi:hypothetical protein